MDATAMEEQMRYGLAGLAGLAALSVVGGASAATSTATFSISTTVIKACAISATPLSFGTYDPTAVAADDATSTIDVKCTNGTLYNVGLNAGGSAGASVTSRKMSGGGKTLDYSLYQDTARATNWGNTVGSDAVSGTAGVAATSLTVYGRIPAGQNVPVGSFADTVTATIAY